MLPNLFKDGIQIINTIENNGYEAYFVGGCVRDLLLNKTVGDIDIATSASPQQIIEIFPNVIPVGIDHGTVIVRYKKTSYEVTTFRLEGTYSDQRHPDSVEFISNIEEDLRRRDFTINALAMNVNGDMIDLFSGQTDIENKFIRAVGCASERFMEDPLRMIRALRFSSQLGFSIEINTFKDMKRVKQQISTVAVERITNEMTKLVSGTHVQKGLDYLIDSEIYQYLPVFKNDKALIHKLPTLKQPLESFAEFIALLVSLDSRYDMTEWVTKWKCSNATKQKASDLLRAIHHYMNTSQLNNVLIYHLKSSYFQSFQNILDNLYTDHNVTVSLMNNIKNALPIQSIHDLALSGNDLISIFPNQKKGPWIGKALKKLELKVLNNDIKNTKNHLKEWIKCNPPVVN